jgi:predicted NBD/HSP70 family sugar kinase/DNA-binding transcriptional ArsR family regulator
MVVARLAGSSKLLRAMNESAALALLLERGELTRNELRELTGLSKPTVSEALRRLTEAGLANVVGHVSAGPGPNAEVYAANADAAYAVAVSVRDSAETPDIPAIAAAVCDLKGAIRGRVEKSVDFMRSDPVDAIAGCVTDLCATAGIDTARIEHIQLGVAGSYDARSDTIHHVDVPGWSRPGLIRAIRQRMGTEIGVDNDVNLATVAERRRGAAQHADSFALLWLGEGLGLAIDLGGTLMRGARGGAGEIRYLPLFVPDALGGHEQGKVDFHETVAGRAVLGLAEEHGFAARTPAEALAAAAATLATGGTGVDGATAFLTAVADRIAVGLAAVVAVLDPPLVVLGGELGRAGGPALRDAVAAAMRRAAPLETTIATTSIDDDAVLLGGLETGLAAVREALITSQRAFVQGSTLTGVKG